MRIIYLPKMHLHLYADTTEPELYPHAYAELVEKKYFDNLENDLKLMGDVKLLDLTREQAAENIRHECNLLWDVLECDMTDDERLTVTEHARRLRNTRDRGWTREQLLEREVERLRKGLDLATDLMSVPERNQDETWYQQSNEAYQALIAHSEMRAQLGLKPLEIEDAGFDQSLRDILEVREPAKPDAL